jgi:iron complex transport system ATP-binding protein
VFHDINRALQFADKLLVLKEGYVYGDGDSKIVNPEIMKGVYGIDLDVLNTREGSYYLYK